MPNVVSQAEWQKAIDELRVKEKAQMKLQDKLNAERRRLPMVEILKSYTFTGPEGEVSLLDLFEGRSQLIIYHFMFGPDADEGCTGCSMMVDNMGHPAHLHARDTSFALISRAPLRKLQAFQERMGWSLPWFSSFGSDFNADFGTSSEQGEMFALSVFLREGDNIYRTYFTDRRGVEYLGSSFTYLDLTPFGRQELWEDSPQGVPQGAPYQWWRKHDRYEEPARDNACHSKKAKEA